jgi:hypothetical protein
MGLLLLKENLSSLTFGTACGRGRIADFRRPQQTDPGADSGRESDVFTSRQRIAGEPHPDGRTAQGTKVAALRISSLYASRVVYS